MAVIAVGDFDDDQAVVNMIEQRLGKCKSAENQAEQIPTWVHAAAAAAAAACQLMQRSLGDSKCLACAIIVNTDVPVRMQLEKYQSFTLYLDSSKSHVQCNNPVGRQETGQRTGARACKGATSNTAMRETPRDMYTGPSAAGGSPKCNHIDVQ